MLPNCTATQFLQLALSRNHSTPRSGPMAASLRDLEHTAQLQFVRAQKAEQKAEDVQHALNLMLNFGFERFHMALTVDGAVHEFELGTVRNLPTPDEIDWLATLGEQHATAESSSGEPCSREDTSMHRRSTMPSS